MLSPSGMCVEPVTAFFRDLLAAGRAEATVRSYGLDLLRWFRFLWTVEVAWDRATRMEARDFSRWLRFGRNGSAYAASVRAHSETVLRSFYDFHLAVVAVRWSTRSHWTAPGPGGPMPITIPWSPTDTNAAGCIGPGCRHGSRAVSPTRSSTRSSPGCRRTETVLWSPFTCPPGLGRRNCCRRPWMASTLAGS